MSVPILTDLEAAHVEIYTLKERLFQQQDQVDALRRASNQHELTAARQRATPPPKDDHLWDWATQSYVKKPDPVP